MLPEGRPIGRRSSAKTALTFAEHGCAVAGFARRLQKIGVEGERVAVLMTNCLEMPVCILGAMAAHAYVAPMNPNYSDSELTPLLKDADPKVIVTLPEFYPRLSKVAAAMGIPHVLVVGEGPGHDRVLDQRRRRKVYLNRCRMPTTTR